MNDIKYKQNILNFNLYNEYYKKKMYNILKNKDIIKYDEKINDFYNKNKDNKDNTSNDLELIKSIINNYNIYQNNKNMNIFTENILSLITEDTINKILIKKYKLNRYTVYKYLVLLLLLEKYNSNEISFSKQYLINDFKNEVNKYCDIITYSESIDNIPHNLIDNIDPDNNESYNKFIKNNYNTDCLTNLKIILSLNNFIFDIFRNLNSFINEKYTNIKSYKNDMDEYVQRIYDLLLNFDQEIEDFLNKNDKNDKNKKIIKS